MSERSMAGLLRLREVTRRARGIPGAVLLLEPVRRWFTRERRSAVVRYDRNVLIEVSLGEHMGSHLFWYGAYSRDILATLDRLLTPGMVVLDVGANIGEISLAAAGRVAPGGRVYSFEPSAPLAAQLRRNAALNADLMIEVVPSALGATAGRATLFDASEDFADGSRHGGVVSLFQSHRNDVPTGETAVITLDEYVTGAGLARTDLIKIDVEGAELAVLQGASRTLERFRPPLIIEVQKTTSRAAGYAQRDLLDLLTPLGYRFKRIGRRGRLSPITPESLGPFQNVLCLPPTRR